MVISTCASLAGMGAGLVTWFFAAQTHGTLGVATGYLIGTLLIGGIPVGLVWRSDAHGWASLFGRLGLGLAIMILLAIGSRRFAVNYTVDCTAAAAFLCLWILLMRPEVKLLVHLIRPKHGSKL
jgi:hypothetical protein